MKQKKKSNFKFAYVVFLCVLAVLAIAAIVYVKVLLVQYEKDQPEYIIRQYMDTIASKVKDGTFEDALPYPFPETSPGKFESGKNIKETYFNMYCSDDLKIERDHIKLDGSEATYYIKYGDLKLFRFDLKSGGEPRQKLIIFIYHDWKVENNAITPIIKTHSYDIEVPSDFSVRINNIPLGEEEEIKETPSNTEDAELDDQTDSTETGEIEQTGENSVKKFRVDGLYLQPDIKITASDGTEIDYKIKRINAAAASSDPDKESAHEEFKVTPIIFKYQFTLPESLTVSVNGIKETGVPVSDGRLSYSIMEIKEPDIEFTDSFDNTVKIENGKVLPYTSKRITVPEEYRVKVSNYEVPVEWGVKGKLAGLDEVSNYCSITGVVEYSISVLEDNARIQIFKPDGESVDLSSFEGSDIIDLTDTYVGSDTVPDEIAYQINVLQVAEMWSKFMSQDLEGDYYGFSNISGYLIAESKMYKEARAWADGIDRTFTSPHTLLPFENENVSNFTYLSDECFRVDISFKKIMNIQNGNVIEENSNHRYYFVKYTDYYGTGWKLVYMREILD